MEIQLSSDTPIYIMGWYGTCENEEPFQLSTIENKLKKVLQLNEFGSALYIYDVNKPSWQNYPFTTLNRGYSYMLVFEIVDENASDEEKIVSIPGFTSALHQGYDRSVWPPMELEPGEGFGRTIADCDSVQAKTPIWLSFSATDVDTDNHFTNWHEMTISDEDNYSKLVPKNSDTLSSDLTSFSGTNLLNIALVQENDPNVSVDPKNIFGNGDIDLSCKECGAILPRLVLVDSNDNKFYYTDRIYKESENCYGSNQLSTKESSSWYQAPVVYNTINAPQKSATIKELYFDTSDGSKLKFEGFKC